MGSDWDYAQKSAEMKRAGGPDAYHDSVRSEGKAEGRVEGALVVTVVTAAVAAAVAVWNKRKARAERVRQEQLKRLDDSAEAQEGGPGQVSDGEDG